MDVCCCWLGGCTSAYGDGSEGCATKEMHGTVYWLMKSSIVALRQLYRAIVGSCHSGCATTTLCLIGH